MRRFLATGLIAAALPALAASPTWAQTSVQNGSTAVTAGSRAVGALTESGVQTASAAAILPASVAATGSVVAGAIVGGTGSVVAQGAQDSANAAYGRTPLVVTRKVVVTAQPAPKVPYDAPTAGPAHTDQPK